MKIFLISIALWLGVSCAAFANPASVWVEELTWPEIAAAIKDGTDAILIPTGGTEQNGPHLATGKHNQIVRYTAQHIAQQVGHMLVAPVIAYVPEGRINPPDGHMQFPGTISIGDEHFAALLEDTARSFKQHGFTTICFIGDHGGSQAVQQSVTDKLNKEWQGEGVRVVQVGDYYTAKDAEAWAKSKGIGIKDPAAHAGFMDTSELLAAYPQNVRNALIEHQKAADFATTGVKGDPSHASEAYGKKLLDFKIHAAVSQIQKALAQ